MRKLHIGLMLIFIVVVVGFVPMAAEKTPEEKPAYRKKTTIIGSGTFYPECYFIHGRNGYSVVKRDNFSFSFLSFVIVSGGLDYFAKVRLDLTWSSLGKTYLLPTMCMVALRDAFKVGGFSFPLALCYGSAGKSFGLYAGTLKRWETLSFFDKIYLMLPVCVVPVCYRPGSFYSSVVAYPHLIFIRGSYMLSVEAIFTVTGYYAGRAFKYGILPMVQVGYVF